MDDRSVSEVSFPPVTYELADRSMEVPDHVREAEDDPIPVPETYVGVGEEKTEGFELVTGEISGLTSGGLHVLKDGEGRGGDWGFRGLSLSQLPPPLYLYLGTEPP